MNALYCLQDVYKISTLQLLVVVMFCIRFGIDDPGYGVYVAFHVMFMVLAYCLFCRPVCESCINEVVNAVRAPSLCSI